MREPQREYMPRQPSLPAPHSRPSESLDGNTTTAHPQPNATSPAPTSRAHAPLTRPHSFIHADRRLVAEYLARRGVTLVSWGVRRRRLSETGSHGDRVPRWFFR